MKQLSLCAKRALCLLLALLMSTACLPLTAHAAGVWTEDEILSFFDTNHKANYDENYFLLEAEEIALLMASVMEEEGLGCDVIYDSEKSTKTEEKYFLMCPQYKSKDNSSLVLPVTMHTTGGPNRVWSLSITFDHTKWQPPLVLDVVSALTAFYGRLCNNMAPENWDLFATDRNLAKTDEGYSLTGAFSGLYYNFHFQDAYIKLTLSPDGNLKNPSGAEYFQEGSAFIREKDFTVTTGKLERDLYGNIAVEVILENTGKNPLTIHLDHAQAAGVSCPLSIFCTIAPGNRRTETLRIPAAFLAGTEETYLGDVRLVFVVTDAATGKDVFSGAHVLPLGIPLDFDYEKSGKVLFRNGEFTLTLLGSYKDSENSAPKLLVKLENNVYGEVRLENESGVCTIGKEEYPMYANVVTGRYSNGIAVLSPLNYTGTGKTSWTFDLQICTRNYNPLVGGNITVKLDADGKIAGVSGKLKEVSHYDSTLKSEY